MKSDRDELARVLAKLKAVEGVPAGLRRYVNVVIAETEQDLARSALGPRHGRSVFELHGGAQRLYPELEEAKETMFWLGRISTITGRLPDYFPWRFAPQSEAVVPILDPNNLPCAEEVRRWGAGSWRIRYLEPPLQRDFYSPFVVPTLDALSSEGWWLVDRRERVEPLMDLGRPQNAAGKTGEICLLEISPGNGELARRFTNLNPSFNKEVHFLAVSGRPKSSFMPALLALVDEAASALPDLTVAEAVLREIWQSPSRDLAEHFEESGFFVAASTGYAENRLWITEAAGG